MNIGLAIKAVRTARQIPGYKLCEALHLSIDDLVNIESGERKIDGGEVQGFADALGVPLPILLYLSADSGEINEIGPESQQRLADIVMSLIKDL